MARKEIQLRDAMAAGWAAARLTGGRFARLGPVYADRAGLAYEVLRGRQIRRSHRPLLLIALAGATAGAVAVLGATVVVRRYQDTVDGSEDTEQAAAGEAAAGEAAAGEFVPAAAEVAEPAR
jgi:hypothetical protein